MKKHSGFLVFALLLLCAVFVSCSSDSSDDDELVTKYAYNLTANNNYYSVYVYECVDNGNNTYNVKEYTIHAFLKTSSKYSGCTGSELCAVVRAGRATPVREEAYILKEGTTRYANKGESTQLTYYLPEGLTYYVKYYK